MNLKLFRNSNSIFLINCNEAIEKIKKRNGENINIFFNNNELGVSKKVLLA